MEISTRAWKRSYMARGMRRVPTYYQDLFDIIGKNPGHVIGSTACLGGVIPSQIMKAKNDDSLNPKIENWLTKMNEVFGGNLYLELQPSESKEQTYVNRKLIELSNKLHIPYIITTDTHYLTKEDRIVHKAYLNAQNGDREVDDFYATTYLMDTEELKSHLDLSDTECEIAFQNIENIANSIESYSIRKPLRIPDLPWKEHNYELTSDWVEKIPYLKTFNESDYKGDKELVRAVLEGIANHPDLQNQRAYDEINSNLEMTWVSSNVNKAHWSAYYLNLQKIIDLCWEAGSLVGPGRGSGVGFILLYVLGITQINPLSEKTKTFAWRFLNPDRVSVLDVDFDIEGGRRGEVLNKFRKFYTEDRVANVATFGTEKSKSAILTACRGLGIDVDIAQYLSSLIPADRGQLRSLDQCMYGDTENDWEPIKQFVIEMTDNYPEVWEVAHKIEGLICRSGIHAGGVIFVDEDFTNSCGLMRAPDGTLCTQFELHDAEAVSLIKYDALSVEAMDKIHNCLDLLCEYGYIEKKDTLKETYEAAIGVYNIERDNPEMWKMVWEHKIQSLFQMEGQTGIQGIEQLHPTSVDDLAILNSTLRLMAQEKGGEMPTAKLARFKANAREWDKEISDFGLPLNVHDILDPVLKVSYGLCIAQEQFMELVQLPELGGFSLTWADKLRKSIAKKNPKEYDKLTKEFYEVTAEKGINQEFAHYVWDVLIAMSKGYGFNQSHTLAYSLIALQEMNLAFKYPIIFWNTACLITDSGGSDNEDEEEEENYEEEITYFNEMEDFGIDDSEDDVVDSYDEDEDCDGYPVEVKVMNDGKKKKKAKVNNYGKIATAIGKMKAAHIKVSLPDINYSSYTFTPDVENNTVRFGLSGISRINNELIDNIINNRPYTSLEDFTSKVKTNKTQMVNLIKCGAFDEFGDRMNIMKEYIYSISDIKKKLNGQNINGLIVAGLLPEELKLEQMIFNYNKYLKKIDYKLDDIAYNFYEKHFDLDLIQIQDGERTISKDVWKKIYDSYMFNIKEYIKANHDDLLDKLNAQKVQEMWDKYCLGNLAKWEMDSVSCYSNIHELEFVDLDGYGFKEFYSLPLEPEVDYTLFIKGKKVPILKLNRIIGTVLDRDKAKKTVTLLTLQGVVTVKIYGGVYAQYDKQLSEKGADGKKHVIEKSMFSRGNKIIVSGIRIGENEFLGKKYSKTPWHLVERIVEVKDNGELYIQHDRAEVVDK